MPIEVMTHEFPYGAKGAASLSEQQRAARAELAVLERYLASLMDRILGPRGAAMPRDEFDRMDRMARAIEARMVQFDCLEQELDEMFDDYEPFSLFADLTR